MPQRVLRAEKFKGFTDLPLYNRDTSWLKTCQNFRVMPSGYLEARQGFQKLKPSGGTATDPIAAGIFTGAHEHTMADGWILKATGGGVTFGSNLAQRGYFDIWGVAADTATEDAIYFGANGTFSRVVLYVGQGTKGAAVPTFAYEYYNGSAWTALTTTSTPDFTTVGEQTFEFAIPTNWAATAVNSVLQYWVRIRMSAENDGFTTKCTQTTQKVYCDWSGVRQIYVASSNAAAATNNGSVRRYDQSGTTAAWTALSTALFSGNFARTRFASYRNLLYFVNGKEQKRWDGNTLADIGFTTPTSSGATVSVAAAGNLNGAYSYKITYGYGPAGEWGESSDYTLGTATPANNSAVWTLNLTSIPAAAEKIYLYRSTDLTSVPTSARSSFPYFRISTTTRDSTGSFPTTITDDTVAFPFPPAELNIATRTPPARCQFITVHKNRMFLASNNQYRGRLWWSEPFEAEAFNTDENFADFTRSTGGQVTGIVEFADQVVVFTEDKMFGVANVDQDQPSIYEIAVVGCVAPDSIATADGNLMWLGRNGVYRWTGEGLPQRVSNDTSTAFGKLSFETHGGSRGVIHNRMYEVYMLSNGATELTIPRYRYDLVTDSWSRLVLGLTGKIAPLISVTAPLGHADAGVRHPLYGQADKSGTNYAIYLGEYTESDDASSFTLAAEVHFGPPLYKMIRPDSAFAVYIGGSGTGWNTPTLDGGTALNAAIGTGPVMQTAGPTDGAADYTQITYVYKEPGESSGDQLVKFTVTTVTTTGTITSGSEGKLLGVYLDADVLDPQDGV